MAAFGYIIINISGLPQNSPRPLVIANYADSKKRFDVQIGPITETVQKGQGKIVDGQVTITEYLRHVVPGDWIMAVSLGGWNISQKIHVRKKWINIEGNNEGSETVVDVVFNQPGMAVSCR